MSISTPNRQGPTERCEKCAEEAGGVKSEESFIEYLTALGPKYKKVHSEISTSNQASRDLLRRMALGGKSSTGLIVIHTAD